ncbi:DUF2690 domain-containing protein [Umezawaea tangerina]|uniref:Uncharacterized protein DUF2690 n=1 Tax=Umezawaea tangerina TaxID=84725 RepID=A0A2T0SQL8_9PSEU|nr:DUF2690 domain-containing protein [Umezawaea tangerina]PRY35711.1 uncharacterized protein DUF2690 [Umezawaea tangerina]
MSRHEIGPSSPAPRPRSLARRVAVLLTAVAGMLALSTGAAVAGPEHHNTDPLNTGCAANATTITSGTVGGIFYEIRYSAACGTNWVRVPALNGTVYMVIRSDWGGGAVGGQQTGSGGSHWTPQVYAPGSTCVTYWVQRVGNGDPATGNVRLC